MTAIKSNLQAPLPDALAAPACVQCGAATRFVGIECHPTVPNADLCTYECGDCGCFEVAIIARVGTGSILHSVR